MRCDERWGCGNEFNAGYKGSALLRLRRPPSVDRNDRALHHSISSYPSDAAEKRTVT